MESTSFLGSLAGIVPDVIEQFNYQKQENDLAIAEANARAAEANAASSPDATKKNWIWIVAIVGIVAIIMLIISRSNS